MKKKPPIFYIFILLLNVEFFTVILLWLSLKDPFDYPSVLYRSVIIFSVINLALWFAVELAKDLLLKQDIVLLEYIKYRVRNFRQIFSIGIAKLIQRYKGTVLGWVWSVLKPSINIFIIWFAIEKGLRNGGNMGEYPYFLWMMTGYIPWLYMKDMFSFGAGSFRNNAYLLKVADYPIITIPSITNISLIPVHLFLVMLMIAVFWLSGYTPTVYLIQLPLYMLMMFIFFDFWGLFSGVLSVVSRDFMNLVNSLVTATLWISGIFYDINNIHSTIIRLILGFNPFTIFVVGFRHCFIDHIWFYQDPKIIVNYCIVLLAMMLMAVRAYKKFGKILPDVL